uniref:(northern house mosquito) hypothetical protein n=1 Tax=Culex pipiens TaxID=7175 RepID=A0A8D8F1R9_CULPI
MAARFRPQGQPGTLRRSGTLHQLRLHRQHLREPPRNHLPNSRSPLRVGLARARPSRAPLRRRPSRSVLPLPQAHPRPINRARPLHGPDPRQPITSRKTYNLRPNPVGGTRFHGLLRNRQQSRLRRNGSTSYSRGGRGAPVPGVGQTRQQNNRHRGGEGSAEPAARWVGHARIRSAVCRSDESGHCGGDAALEPESRDGDFGGAHGVRVSESVGGTDRRAAAEVRGKSAGDCV